MSGNAFVVERNEMLVKMYRSIFTAMNCSISHARTKEDALRRLEGRKPDLLIVDERLADGSGVDAMREIRSRADFAGVPIIATITARSGPGDDELRALGVQFIVTKPWQVSAFSSLVQRCLKSRP